MTTELNKEINASEDQLSEAPSLNHTDDLKQRITPYLKEIFERKAERVVAMDIGALTSYADVVIVVTATSQRQAAAIAEHLYIKMKQTNHMPLGVEGMKEGSWALLDFGDVIIHIFNRETREFYDIEGLWSDAPRLDLSDFNPQTE